MPITLGWHDIALRLLLSIVAGSLMGLDRGEHGRPAGLRTTLLVCLAAAVAMLQANLLLGTAGKASNSFVVLDLMRLPLGILTGMGFIGAGAILRRDGLVVGVTTAATLWFVTVIGLCFGGGQLALGGAALALGMIVLSGLRWAETRMKQDQRGKLIVTANRDDLIQEEICSRAANDGYRATVSSALINDASRLLTLEFRLHWRSASPPTKIPPFVDKLSQDPRISNIRWETA
jgi:putative Mg2+ transporter-C (MgtC) family protein